MNLLAEIHPGIVYPLVVLLSFVLVYLAAAVSRRQGMVDVPGDRQSHTVPTVTGGGIGLIAVVALFSSVRYYSQWKMRRLREEQLAQEHRAREEAAGDHAIGKRPSTVVRVVMRIGRSRMCAARMTAASLSSPARRC